MCTFAETQPQDRALEVARFGDLPDGEQYYRINDSIRPRSEACKLRRTAYPAGGAPIPVASTPEVDELEPIMPQSAPVTQAPEPVPADEPPSRSMAPPPPVIEPSITASPNPELTLIYVGSYDTLNLSPYLALIDGAVDQSRPIEQINIRAYTDTIGSTEDNLQRTERFAGAVAAYLVNQGIDARLISTEGDGEANLAVETADEVAEPLNRRVEIEVFYPEP